MGDLPTCGKPCPEHGYPCSTVDWYDLPEGDRDLYRMMMGKEPPKGHTIHLCLHDPKNPHTWTEEVK